MPGLNCGRAGIALQNHTIACTGTARAGELRVDASIRRIYGGVATWYTSDVFCTSGNAVKLDPSKRRIAKTDMM